MPLIKIATTTELNPGQGKPVVANGKPLALFNVAGTFFCIDNTCCHVGGPLGEGSLEGTTVVCPWHGWEFNVTTGECLMPGGAKVQSYKVEVQGKDVLVEI